jgi:hypothetical protein
MDASQMAPAAWSPHLSLACDVISNKVHTAGDGRWRSLDGRPLHAAVVAISEHYNAVLADHITRTFGMEWEQRDRGKDHNAAWELAAVSEPLIREFSSRSRDIEIEKDRLVEEYVAQHGRRPSSAEVIRLRAKATLTTRPEKKIRSLADLTAEWRGRAGKILGTGAPEWARRVTTGRPSHAPGRRHSSRRDRGPWRVGRGSCQREAVYLAALEPLG